MTLQVVLLSTLIIASFFVLLILSIIVFYFIKKKEWIHQLQEYPSFSKEEIGDSKINYQYGKKSDVNLTKLRGLTSTI